jgi:hypothetical protein
MTNSDDLLAEYEEGGYVFPAYGDRCFADVTESALSLLTPEFDRALPDEAFGDLLEDDIDRVVVLLLDGLGLDQWNRLHDELPFIQAFEENGWVTPITSVYPSETAAAITTLHTGLLPAEHGLLGWHQYFEGVGQSIQTLPFLLEDGTPVHDEDPLASARELFEGESIYGAAEDAGIDTHAAQPQHIADSASSRMTTAGAETNAFWNVADVAVNIRDTLEDATGPTHVTAYVPNVDSISHATGTAAARYDAQVRMITEAVRHELVDGLDAETAERTALLVTADHGHTDVDQSEAVDLDVPAVQDTLEQDDDGESIPPVGGPRNVQFHVEDGRVEELRAYLERNHDVLTLDRDEYTDRGLFGENHAETSETFERRAPDLVAVHKETVMWYHGDDKIGVHGGMTPEEMLVPLATARVSDLQD